MKDPLQTLLDRLEIETVIKTHGRGTDRFEPEIVRACYHPDAVDDHGEFIGMRDDFIAYWSNIAKGLSSVTHFLGNCLIEFASDSIAIVETCFIADLHLEVSDASVRAAILGAQSPNCTHARYTVRGRYIDRFDKRGGAWLIARRRVVYDAAYVAPVLGQPNPQWTYSSQDDGKDPLWSIRTEAGLPPYPSKQ